MNWCFQLRVKVCVNVVNEEKERTDLRYIERMNLIGQMLGSVCLRVIQLLMKTRVKSKKRASDADLWDICFLLISAALLNN